MFNEPLIYLYRRYDIDVIIRRIYRGSRVKNVLSKIDDDDDDDCISFFVISIGCDIPEKVYLVPLWVFSSSIE